MRYLKFTKPVTGKVASMDGKELNTEGEYPQFDNLLEVLENAGDAKELSSTERSVLESVKATKTREYINGRVRGSAKQAITNAIASGDKALGEDRILSDARKAGHDWSIEAARSRGTGVTARAAAFDDIMARVRSGEKVSQEELATLASQFGA